VEVATSTTGEGDYHLERLSMLHSVATGYSSLIFDMKPTTGFKELCKKCNSLWKALEDNHKLPLYLVKIFCIAYNMHFHKYKRIRNLKIQVRIIAIKSNEAR